MDLDPTLLRTFVAVTESGGFTRAAERLHLTQSAVSHQIRRLEEQLGCSLLHRTTRRLTLTEDGEDFLRHAEQILQSLDALSRRFQPSPITGVVRFGVPENFIGDRLPNLLCQFARAFPAVRMDISVSMSMDLRQMVDADELDLAVVIALPGGAADTVLRRTRFVWVASDTFDVAPGRSLPFAFFLAVHQPPDRRVRARRHRCGVARDVHLAQLARLERGDLRGPGHHRDDRGRRPARHAHRRRPIRPALAAAGRIRAAAPAGRVHAGGGGVRQVGVGVAVTLRGRFVRRLIRR
ncbi:LysR family transcriptional regulator [Lysobacter gummosus]|uniref:LysR family transcriptional regulator n=1 Tax=Lysobacter gummosus TaxID=262324 RepID=UPI0036366C17